MRINLNKFIKIHFSLCNNKKFIEKNLNQRNRKIKIRDSDKTVEFMSD